jgi:hypothetical protein
MITLTAARHALVHRAEAMNKKRSLPRSVSDYNDFIEITET